MFEPGRHQTQAIYRSLYDESALTVIGDVVASSDGFGFASVVMVVVGLGFCVVAAYVLDVVVGLAGWGERLAACCAACHWPGWSRQSARSLPVVPLQI